jgi:hypothetical protein
MVNPGRVLKNVETSEKTVIPAQAGIQQPLIFLISPHWTPACAGVTVSFSALCQQPTQETQA